jgi:undecaprenyl-diphosphatase
VHLGAIAHAAARMAPANIRGWLWPMAAALAGTRVVLLAHYLSDVLTGLALGVMIDKFVARPLDRKGS